MVHARQDVAMHIGIIEEFNLLFLALEEFAKHIYKIIYYKTARKISSFFAISQVNSVFLIDNVSPSCRGTQLPSCPQKVKNHNRESKKMP